MVYCLVLVYGVVMTKIQFVCYLCGEKSKSKNKLASCPICGVSFENSKEKVLKNTDCISSEGLMGVHTKKGALFLTNQRIFWLRRHGTIRHPGRLFLMDMIDDALFPYSKEMGFSFGLDEITNVEIIKKGPLKIFMLTVGDRIIVLEIKAKYRQEWLDAINDAKKHFISEKS